MYILYLGGGTQFGGYIQKYLGITLTLYSRISLGDTERTCVILGIKFRLATCKVSTLPVVLFVQ